MRLVPLAAGLLVAGFSAAAVAKLPPLSDDAKAKAAEAAAKAAWGDKVAAFKLCQSMDRVAEQYRKSDFVKEKKSKRVWLAADKLFTDAHGKEELTEEGKKALDMAMSDFTSYLPNKPLMVEGYADRGSPAEEYRKSEQRAELVRDYLASRFQLKPQYTGTMPLSDSPPEQSGQSNWDGVSLVILT